MSTFFGLTPEYKLELHKSIFSLVTYGKGGWTWEAVYHQIPVYLRNFYINEMSKAIQKENEAYRGKPSGQAIPRAVRDAMKTNKRK